MLAAVEQGMTAQQRVTINGAPLLVVGLPMSAVPAEYVQAFPMRDLDNTFRFLGAMLVTGTVVSALLGALGGQWVSRRALRPLNELNQAAAQVAAGDLTVRLPTRDDPDLGPLAIAFNETTEKLRRRLERDARFAGDVSHELRSPVTTMLNALEVLRRRCDELSPGAQQAVQLLHTELSRFRRTIDDLLEISRGDQGRATLYRERLDLVDLAERATQALRGPVPVEHGRARPQVVGDRRRLERVIVNLVDNAHRHGGGLVRLAVLSAGGTARVEVDDAGPGVHPAHRERIFERFARGSVPERVDKAGSGLGLALAGQHVQVHGGRLVVEARPGGGARFVVELPAVDPAEPSG